MAVGEHLRKSGGEGIDHGDVREALFVGAHARVSRATWFRHHRSSSGAALRSEQVATIRAANGRSERTGSSRDRGARLFERALREPFGPAEDVASGFQLVCHAGDRLPECTIFSACSSW